MAFDTIIGNGSVVTATDTYVADLAIADGKIAAIAKVFLERMLRGCWTHQESSFSPAASMSTPIWICPSAVPPAPTILKLELGPQPRRNATTLIDFAIQYRGQPLRKAFDTWMDKASKKAVCDYAFHCIVTDISNGQLQEMNTLVGEGVTSFKLFMAYPGVFMLDDASIFRALQTTAKNGGLICMHAENGSAIDVIVQQALAEGKTAPKVSRTYSGRLRRRPKLSRARLRYLRWLERPSTLCT